MVRILALGISSLLVVGGVWLWCRPGEPPAPGNIDRQQSRRQPDTPVTNPVDRLIAKLVEQGWKRGTAEGVAKNLRSFVEAAARVAPKEVDRLITRLRRLPRTNPIVMRCLRDHPETVGLLMSSSKPEIVTKIARSLTHPDYEQRLKVYLLSFAEPAEIADALLKHGVMIRRLYEYNLVGAEAFFLHTGSTRTHATYDKWLHQVFDDALRASDENHREALDEAVTLVSGVGYELRQLLREDATVREKLLPTIWPAMKRLLKSQPILTPMLSFEPKEIWKVLALENGEECVRKAGLTAVHLLGSESPLPARYRKLAIKAILSGDENALISLLRYGDQPALHRLLERDVADRVRAGALSLVKIHGKAKLSYLARLSDQALTDEVVPTKPGIVSWLPGYGAFVLVKKLAQGRQVSRLDIAMAALDVVPLGSPVAKIAKFGKAVAPANKAIATRLKAASRKKLADHIGEKSLRRMGKAAESGLLNAEHFRVSVAHARRLLKEQSADRWGVDITHMVRLFYRVTGRGKTRRLLGQDARLFMRSDAKVLLRVDVAAKSAGKTSAIWTGKNLAAMLLYDAVEAAIEDDDARWKAHVAVRLLLESNNLFRSRQKTQ